VLVGRRPAYRTGRARCRFQALQPAGIEATLRAIEHANGDHQARVRSAELEFERTQIHADRPRRQFDAREPENRLVAHTLEREWELQLTDVGSAERAVAEVAANRPDPLTEEGIAWCRSATPTCARCSTRPPPPTASASSAHRGAAAAGSHTRCTDQQTIALVRQLAERYPRQADRRDPRPPATADRRQQPVHSPPRRRAARPPHWFPRAPSDQPATMARWSRSRKPQNELGVSTATVHRWLCEGFIVGEQITAGARWQILHHRALRQRVCAHPPDGWLPLAQAAPALGVARQTVLHKVQRGDLASVYVQKGKRKGLRIQVKPEQVALELVLQQVEHRPPLHAGGLPPDDSHLKATQPVGQHDHTAGGRRELADLLPATTIVVHRDPHAGGDLRLVDIETAQRSIKRFMGPPEGRTR
jgi:hypothetical protein